MKANRKKRIMIDGKVAMLGDNSDIHPASYPVCECGSVLSGVDVELIDPEDIDREDSYVVAVMCCECFARHILPQAPS